MANTNSLKELDSESAYTLLRWFFANDEDLIANRHVLKGRSVETCMRFNIKQFEEGYTRFFTDSKYDCLLAITETKGHNWITMMYVRPDSRSNGLGKSLVEKAKELSPERLYTVLPEHNEIGHSFYKAVSEKQSNLFTHKNMPVYGYRIK